MPEALTIITIKIEVTGGRRKSVKAWLVGKRVVVHETSYPDGTPEDMPKSWTISDPVTGRRYPFVSQLKRETALKIAREFVRRHGSNPLAGGKWDAKAGRFSKKPTQYDAIKKFILDVNYGHINP